MTSRFDSYGWPLQSAKRPGPADSTADRLTEIVTAMQQAMRSGPRGDVNQNLYKQIGRLAALAADLGGSAFTTTAIAEAATS